MRVLLIHQIWVNSGQAGGTRHSEFARSLVEQGHEFSVVTSNLEYYSGQSVTKNRDAVVRDQSDPIQIHRAWTYPSLHRSFLWRVVSFLSFMVTATWAGLRAGKIDVVYGTSPPIFQLVSAYLVSRLRRRPLVIEVRDLWPEFAIEMGIVKNRLIIWFARRVENFFYRAARELIVNSPAYRDYLIKKGVPAQKIHLISNGVDPEMFDPKQKGLELRSKLGLEDKFIVSYTGAMGPANDLSVVLQAAHRLNHQPDIHFLMVGDGKDSSKLKEEATSLGLTNVTFVGTVPKDEVKEVLAASDVCVAHLKNIPMFTTTYPNKIFDYMAAGRPIVLGIDGVIREVVEKGNGGIFTPPGDDESMAKAILEFYENREKGAAMGESGRQYVVEHFHRSDHAKQLEKLLLEVVAGKK